MKKTVVRVALVFACFMFLTGVSHAQQSAQEDAIRIGVSMDLSGDVKYLAEEYLKGAQLFIKDINAHGGISQKPLELVVLDDGYDAQKCAQNTMQLINKENVLALFSYVGTSTTAFSLPIIKANKMTLLGVLSGAQVFQKNPHIFNVRASYYKEIDGFVKHCLKDLNLKKVAVFYQYDAFGMDGLKSTELSLFKHSGYKIEPVATAMYKRGNANIEEAFKTIKDSGAEAVILVGVSAPVVDFVNMCSRQNFNPLLYTLSVAGVEFLKKELAEQVKGVIVSHVVPPVQNDSAPLVKEYKELLHKYSPEDNPTLLGLEGFVNARILIETLRRCEGVFTREAFRKALESIKDFDVGAGYPINFGPDDHQGMDKVYYSEVSKGKIRFLDNWNSVNN